MARKNHTITFKNAQVSLDEDTITEFTKDGVNTYSLSEVLEQFSDESQFIDLTLKEVYDLEPQSQEG